MARDDEQILSQARTALLEHGAATPLAVVLLHGFTNNPAQYAEFAPLLYARGVNVFVPRMPLHGYRDRMTTQIASLTASMLLSAAGEAIDIACGLGERVAVLGISMGGVLAAYYAQFRPIERAVQVAPNFSLLRFSYPVSRFVERLVARLPNFFLWWDPRVRANKDPITAYPRFSSHALMQSLRVGEMVFTAARQRAPLAERIVTLVNPHDPAVSNAVTKQVSAMWSKSKPDAIAYVEMAGLPWHHDIIDPQQPGARPDLAYPQFLEALGIGA